MKNLRSLNKYFVKYKWRLLAGILFVTASNWFTVRSPKVMSDVIDSVHKKIAVFNGGVVDTQTRSDIFSMVTYNGLILLGLALLSGIFMFFMRQTIIVMSRHIEYDQKDEIYIHYQQLNSQFYKTHFTGDLMNRISEDVGRVRQYTGPAIMYAVNLLARCAFCIWAMLHVNVWLTIYVVAPLPLLAFTIYYVNKIIYRKSEKIQAQLSDLTTTAQESYSGIRVIKSFVQEKNMRRFFEMTSDAYRKSTVNLSLTEAIYFPSMNFFIGLSMLITVFVGGYLAIYGNITVGNIAGFVIYLNLLMFPISSIGLVASLTQRASASQKRIDEFLQTEPEIISPPNAITQELTGAVDFKNVSFIYQHTGITALKNFSLKIKPGQKIALIGKTGSGKSTFAHLLLRMYDIHNGEVLMDGHNIKEYQLQNLRSQIAYTPQEAFLFSDTIFNNIKFGREEATEADVREAARLADLEKDINGFEKGFDTIVGERGVMLSGGQKQRMVLARALIKNSKLLILDECLSAVDTQTEKTILNNLSSFLVGKTTIVITHRIFTNWQFDKIILMDDGGIAEQGTHDELMQLNGRYAKLYRHQTETAAA